MDYCRAAATRDCHYSPLIQVSCPAGGPPPSRILVRPSRILGAPSRVSFAPSRVSYGNSRVIYGPREGRSAPHGLYM